jgi:hypothetical protein
MRDRVKSSKTVTSGSSKITDYFPSINELEVQGFVHVGGAE